MSPDVVGAVNRREGAAPTEEHRREGAAPTEEHRRETRLPQAPPTGEV